MSHVVPSFVIRYLKESSTTGFLRGGANPNARAQDGLRRRWLCDDCENSFSRSEALFARNAFRRLLEEPAAIISYDRWMLHFCVSLSWRVLVVLLEDGTGQFVRPGRPSIVRQTLDHWAGYLRGEAPLGPYRDHYLLHLDRLPESELRHPNSGRYFASVVDGEFLETPTELMVYVKLPHFALFSVIEEPSGTQWNQAPLQERGIFDAAAPSPPDVVVEFLRHRTQEALARGSLLSARQRQLIEQTLVENVDRVKGADFFEGLKRDVRRFGIDGALEGDDPA